MKKLLISSILIVGILSVTFSQTDTRIRVDRIADIVMKLSIENTTGSNQLMDE
ncbi:MAG: hypothetical protein LBQ60_05425 [Bacteroidales bacterium]|nr:hypothetical protein [Bacteroidales bacterium]